MLESERDPVLEVAAFETDGGIDEKVWFCIFNELFINPHKSYMSAICVKPDKKDEKIPHVHLQGYAGRRTIIRNNMHIKPIEKHFRFNIEDHFCKGLDEEESFKILTQVTVNASFA